MDPRLARTREAALTAATDLLAEYGMTALTHQNVAARAGLGRATVYRHWPTTVDLLLDLHAAHRPPGFVTEGETLRGRIAANYDLQLAHLVDPRSRNVSIALQGAAQDERVHARLVEANAARMRSIADAVGPDYDLHDRRDHLLNVLALMNGPVLQLAAFSRHAIDAEVRATVIDAVVDYLNSYCRTTSPAPAPAHVDAPIPVSPVV
ncbi:TetR/AcrR family transcriptional regulator [Cellulomonas soli]|uniref:TetR family transcriptional regulator n=1 Tax=Cellulomonas soli TaxID=931535 RepID=A0A512P8G6_9CELL|nr:TetR/AcrR family transcriptional regulator [Cellulomonas soli]NYI57644.1 AcrR family transcriptional regulator [Cellulomonas soli]GEP67422.1 TetR family transcriptional regulator [Cellulomonas soli]